MRGNAQRSQIGGKLQSIAGSFCRIQAYQDIAQLTMRLEPLEPFIHARRRRSQRQRQSGQRRKFQTVGLQLPYLSRGSCRLALLQLKPNRTEALLIKAHCQ